MYTHTQHAVHCAQGAESRMSLTRLISLDRIAHILCYNNALFWQIIMRWLLYPRTNAKSNLRNYLNRSHIQTHVCILYIIASRTWKRSESSIICASIDNNRLLLGGAWRKNKCQQRVQSLIFLLLIIEGLWTCALDEDVYVCIESEYAQRPLTGGVDWTVDSSAPSRSRSPHPHPRAERSSIMPRARRRRRITRSLPPHVYTVYINLMPTTNLGAKNRLKAQH